MKFIAYVLVKFIIHTLCSPELSQFFLALCLLFRCFFLDQSNKGRRRYKELTQRKAINGSVNGGSLRKKHSDSDYRLDIYLQQQFKTNFLSNTHSEGLESVDKIKALINACNFG